MTLPTPRRSSATTIFLITFAIGFLGLFGLWLLNRGWRDGDAEARAAHAAVMTNYFRALAERRYADAWRDFTTERFRAAWSLDQYAAAQQPRAWKAARDIRTPDRDFGQSLKGGVRIKYIYSDLLNARGERFYLVWYSILDTPAGPRIDATARQYVRVPTRSNSKSDGLEPEIPEPW
jgi:hypothetical protein